MMRAMEVIMVVCFVLCAFMSDAFCDTDVRAQIVETTGKGTLGIEPWYFPIIKKVYNAQIPPMITVHAPLIIKYQDGDETKFLTCEVDTLTCKKERPGCYAILSAKGMDSYTLAIWDGVKVH